MLRHAVRFASRVRFRYTEFLEWIFTVYRNWAPRGRFVDIRYSIVGGVWKKFWEEKTTVPADTDIAEALPAAIRKNRASLREGAEKTA